MAQSEHEILYGLADILNEQTGVSMSSIRLESSIRAALVESSPDPVIGELADKFGVTIPVEEFGQFRTAGDVVAFIQAAQE